MARNDDEGKKAPRAPKAAPKTPVVEKKKSRSGGNSLADLKGKHG